jgi:hypothetical protein
MTQSEQYTPKREAVVMIGAISRRIREPGASTPDEATLDKWLEEIRATLAGL